MSKLGDIPQEVRPDRAGAIVGTGGPNVRQVAERISRPNNVTFVNTGYTVGTDSVQVLPSNGNRKYILIQNNSAGNIYISFGNKANDYDGVEIQAGGNYEPYIVPSSSVHVVAAGADSNIVVVEGYGG